MSWNYSGDPSDSPLDAVRFYLQDTDETAPQMQDEEIEYFRTQILEPVYGKVTDSPLVAMLVAAYLADVLVASYREPSISADGVSIDYSGLASRYSQIASSLRMSYQNLAGVGGVPLVGGINFWDDFDPSVKPLVFGLKMHDNYRAGQQSYSGSGEIPSSENYEEGGMWTG